MTALFSQRNGYTSINDIIIREDMPKAIQNAICNCYDDMDDIDVYDVDGWVPLKTKLSKFLWIKFLNRREREFYNKCYYDKNYDVFIDSINDPDIIWYQKLDILEVTLAYIQQEFNSNTYCVEKEPLVFVNKINEEFNRLHYAYRVLNNKIVEITSKEEIIAVETAISDSDGAVKMHLSKALELCAKKPEGDYRNSIKESISAVERWCREKTNANDLRTALNKLKTKGILIHSRLHSAFDKLYEYTNDKETGIRHALMDDEETYTPTYDEAIYMIITCSAFINYLNKKVK